MFEWEQNKDVLTFGGALDVTSVESLQGILQEAISQERIILDLSRVNRLDTAAAQLLTALCRSDRGSEVKLIPSQAVTATLNLLGLGEHLGSCLLEEAD